MIDVLRTGTAGNVGVHVPQHCLLTRSHERVYSAFFSRSWNAFREAAARVARWNAAAAARRTAHTLRQSQGVDPRLTDRTFSGQLLFTFMFVTGALHAGVHKVGTTRPDAARAIAERTK